MALEEPCKDTGMEFIGSTQQVDPQHHPAAVKRLTDPERLRRYAGGELPGRKIDGAPRAVSLGRLPNRSTSPFASADRQCGTPCKGEPDWFVPSSNMYHCNCFGKVPA
jgi:hypothetical protein